MRKRVIHSSPPLSLLLANHILLPDDSYVRWAAGPRGAVDLVARLVVHHPVPEASRQSLCGTGVSGTSDLRSSPQAPLCFSDKRDTVGPAGPSPAPAALWALRAWRLGGRQGMTEQGGGGRGGGGRRGGSGLSGLDCGVRALLGANRWRHAVQTGCSQSSVCVRSQGQQEKYIYILYLVIWDIEGKAVH